jgi:SlyX protein
MTDADARLTELEIALSHQDRVVEELSEIIRDQAGRLTRLETVLARLADRIAAAEGRLDDNPAADQPPPHW